MWNGAFFDGGLITQQNFDIFAIQTAIRIIKHSDSIDRAGIFLVFDRAGHPRRSIGAHIRGDIVERYLLGIRLGSA